MKRGTILNNFAKLMPVNSFRTETNFFSVTPSITTRPIPEFYSQGDAAKVPISKMVASVFP